VTTRCETAVSSQLDVDLAAQRPVGHRPTRGEEKGTWLRPPCLVIDGPVLEGSGLDAKLHYRGITRSGLDDTEAGQPQRGSLHGGLRAGQVNLNDFLAATPADVANLDTHLSHLP